MYSEVCIAIPITSVEYALACNRLGSQFSKVAVAHFLALVFFWAISSIERAVLAKTAQILGICNGLALKNSKSRVKRAISQ
jgi:hypothetical protein